MRFPVKFSRFKGVVPPGEIALGADAVPSGPPAPGSMTNLMTSRFNNINGWPIHRVVVAYKAPALAIALPTTLHIWEEQTQFWYQVGAAVNLEPNRVTFFDVVGLLDGPNTQGQLINPTAGSLSALLVVTDPGGAPNGEHVFAVAPDLTTF